MREDALKVVARPDGKHVVQTVAGDVLVICDSNAKAWLWIDRQTTDGKLDTDRHYRIRQSGPFS